LARIEKKANLDSSGIHEHIQSMEYQEEQTASFPLPNQPSEQEVQGVQRASLIPDSVREFLLSHGEQAPAHLTCEQLQQELIKQVLRPSKSSTSS